MSLKVSILGPNNFHTLVNISTPEVCQFALNVDRKLSWEVLGEALLSGDFRVKYDVPMASATGVGSFTYYRSQRGFKAM